LTHLAITSGSRASSSRRTKDANSVSEGLPDSPSKNSVLGSKNSVLDRNSTPKRTVMFSRQKVAGLARTAVTSPQPIVWRLVLEGGVEQRLSKQEVANYFGAGEGKTTTVRPFAGARLLQICFWLDWQTYDSAGGSQAIVYNYDALKTEAEMTLRRVHRSDDGRNDYERKVQFERMADRNLVSAVPIFISRHMAYHHSLELVYGIFEFATDSRGKLWLVDARGLHFIPVAVHGNTLGGSAGLGGGRHAGEDGVKKMFRYMSEEALNSIPVSPGTGEKCARMLDTMSKHYQTIKKEVGTDQLLQKRAEVLDICIPVFIGTNRKKLSETFGPSRGDKRGSGKHSTACSQPKTARASPAGFSTVAGAGPARQMIAVPRPPSRNRQRTQFGHSTHRQQRLRQMESVATRPKTPRRPHSPSAHVRSPSAESTHSGRDLLQHSSSRSPSPETRHSGRQQPHARPGQLGFEVVSTLELPTYLAGAGPYMLPEGPTLHEQGPLSLTVPLAGLQQQAQTRTKAKATLRLLRPRSAADSAQAAAERAAKRASMKRPSLLRARTVRVDDPDLHMSRSNGSRGSLDPRSRSESLHHRTGSYTPEEDEAAEGGGSENNFFNTM
jgi:hypothetical protein